MADGASVILSGLADEAASDKSLDQQLAVFAAMGLRYLSLRFLDAGEGVRHVIELSPSELRAISSQLDAYGLRVWSIGSPIGKIKLVDVPDDSRNRYVPPSDYLQQDVRRACDAAEALGTRLIRGFSFYHPRGTDPREFMSQAIDRLGAIVDTCHRRGIIYGLEVEANLVGQSGTLLAEMHRQLAHPALVLVFDGANLRVQGFSPEEIWREYLAMKPALGWIHVKDVRVANENRRPGTFVDEELPASFVPVGMGESAYPRILADLRSDHHAIRSRLAEKGINGICLELEPHLRRGGQFGGYSGADGLGIALRQLCALLDETGLPYQLRRWPI
jgi:sugar phosphate isomerase/epimerase